MGIKASKIEGEGIGRMERIGVRMIERGMLGDKGRTRQG
jgi:hypothetical protein